jgi:integrase/recombinase XerD
MVMRIQGKGNKTADVPVPDPVWEALVDWRLGYERTRKHLWIQSDPVIPSLSPRNRIRKPEDAGKPLVGCEPAALSAVVHRRLADVGITGKRLRAHCLRATAATLAIAAGAQIQEVRQLLRHESLQTTQGYIDFEKAKQADAQDRLNYRLPGSSN